MREKTMGELVRTWRKRAMLTQEQLGVRTGLNTRTIRRIELDERHSRGSTIRRLAEELGLNDAERSLLMRVAGQVAPPAALSQPVGTIPQQLPADVAAFVARARELAMFDDLAGEVGAVVVCAVDGMAGVGKTALAVHAAHRLAPHFPDGNLFVDLYGHTQGMAAADPSDTLARLLGALGVPGEAIPQHVNDRAALYRSLLAGRKMLIVLDNAADEAQVRPLLPGFGGCLVLITSRRRLVGLDEARTIPVDVLPLEDAVSLFAGTAGPERVADVPDEVLAEVVRRCGMLPLAIRLAAARLKAHPAWSVEHLLRRLEGHRYGLGELYAGRRSVAAALDLSYRELGVAERRAYRLLGLHAGADFPPEAAAALLSTTTKQASLTLDRLMEVNLLQEPAIGRYRFHDLIRAHAKEAAAEESESVRRGALARLLDHYGETVAAMVDHLYPYEADVRPRLSPGATSGASTPAAQDAGGWLDAELSNLLALARSAAEHGFSGHVRHLSATLHRCLRTRGRYTEAEGLHLRALAAARSGEDRAGEMEALLSLGEIRQAQCRYEAALKDGKGALDIARATGHRSGELRALNGIGMICGFQGDYAKAAGYFSRALGIARSIGHHTGELDALIASGNVHRITGRYEESANNLTAALDLAYSIGHRTGELRALLGLGFIHLGRGEHRPATGYFTRALELARGTGHRLGELDSLNGLGHVHRIRGRYQAAYDCYRQALDRAREIGNRNWQFEALHSIGRLRHDRGQADEALDCHCQALLLASDLDQPTDQARAHDGLAQAYASLGRRDEADLHWSRALSILISLDVDRTEERGVDVETMRAHIAALGRSTTRQTEMPHEVSASGPGSPVSHRRH
ncbi:ATP-binding protein [Nonomuraea solani]|nr:tetratricopeptide repeat protein [Nonomuraea solani]